MLLFMDTGLLESPGMAKRAKATEQGKHPVTPDDEVRFTAVMRREDRARLKFFCERIGAEMEKVGAQWILDRLAAEEKKLGK
jgi:hypothetical protein